MTTTTPLKVTDGYIYLTNGCGEDTGYGDCAMTAAESQFIEESEFAAFGGNANFGYSYAIAQSKYFGPEVYFMCCEAGADPSRAERKRAMLLAKSALPVLKKAAARFGGTATLTPDDEDGDRHIIRCFCPTEAVIAQFTPTGWQAYWEAIFTSEDEKAAAKAVADKVIGHIDQMYPAMWTGVPKSARTSVRNTVFNQTLAVILAHH